MSRTHNITGTLKQMKDGDDNEPLPSEEQQSLGGILDSVNFY
jgi:hypothetical protein